MIPKEYEGNFEDFEPLTIGPEEQAALVDLRRRTSDRGIEFGQGRTSEGFTRVFTSDDPNGVQIPEDVLTAPGLHLYHAHTNVTPLSASDFRLLTRENVESVTVITSDQSVFVASIGNGWRPTPEEFDEAVRVIGAETDQALMDVPSFFSWSLAERNYAAIRERAYRIARFFEWRLEGGKL